MNTIEWTDVTSNNPCSRCNKTQWCCRSSDGHFEICRFINDGIAITKIDTSGIEYHVYRTNSYSSKSDGPFQRRFKNPPKFEPENRTSALAPEDLDKVYSNLLGLLPLTNLHRSELCQRGLSDVDILRGAYGSMPINGRLKVIAQILKCFESSLLTKVPGFYLKEAGFVNLAGAPGLLIPVRNFARQIVALRIRRDRLTHEQTNKTNAKYIWLSSKSRGGFGPGAQVHIPLSPETAVPERIRITEGELKADVSTAVSGLLTLSLPGVAVWRPALPILKKLKAKTVVIAVDADAGTNRHVATALFNMATALKEAGLEVELETWDGDKAKGIDDALTAGLETHFHRGVQTFKKISEILESAIGANPSSEELKLENARTLVTEAYDQLKISPEIAFQPDILRALLLIRNNDVALWTRFRLEAQKRKVSMRLLESSLEKEAYRQFKEFQRQAKPEETQNRQSSDDDSFNSAGEASRRSSKYEVKNGCLYWNKVGSDSSFTPIQLSNFTAQIQSEETVDDGVEERKTFFVSGVLKNGRQLPKANIRADQFSSMSWITGAWGANAIPTAGMGIKDHLRAAIQEISGDVPSSISYGHTGWRKINGEWFYLFHEGAIGKDGFVEGFNVDLGTSKLKHFSLAIPPSGEELRQSIRASISLLELAPPKIIYPTFAAIYRAVTGEALAIDFAIFLTGGTGIGKSELAALLQAHFGSSFQGKNLPGNWTSTANALELQASAIKDALFTIDDFAPQPNANDMARIVQSAERLFRGLGNQAGRGRLNSDIQQRAERFPRGLILSTGEDLPRGVSLRARLLIIELVRGDICFNKLTHLQELSRAGLFAKSMSAYIQWIAGRMDVMKSEIVSRHQIHRNNLSTQGAHRRAPDMAANLTIGIEDFFQFATESEAVTKEEADKHLARFQAALTEIGEYQKFHQLSDDPVNRFLELIAAAISGERAHIASAANGSAPPSPERWGWRRANAVILGHDSGPTDTFQSRGDRIGWLSADEQLWLQPSIAYATAQKLATEQKTVLSITEQTLWKRMAERGVLITSPKEQRIQMKKTIGADRPYVLVFSDKNMLFDGAPSASEAPENDEGGAAEVTQVGETGP